MPSITFVNMDGESKSFDLEETSNQDALLGGFDHLDKSIKRDPLMDERERLAIKAEQDHEKNN